jgi:hypothetical protein
LEAEPIGSEPGIANDGRHEITAIRYLRLDVVGNCPGAFLPEGPLGPPRVGAATGMETVMPARLLPLYITFIAAHIALIAVVIALG